MQYFESVLKANNRNIEALFGKAKYHELCGNFDDAKDVLNSLVVCYGKFAPPLIEKAKVELALQVKTNNFQYWYIFQLTG